LIYIVATHTGTLALFAMFAVLAQRSGDWSFAALASATGQLGSARHAVLLLALVGFGMKAGLFPFHFWLPPAHAAAPSHVSALMSGVVIKLGIYGLLRVVMLLGSPPAWWGWTVLGLGLLSAVLGVLWALAQHDIKRLLAYHSVENVGIITMGIGIGGLGTAYGHPALSVLGYAGALLHTLNHALFKSVLFFGAGAIARVTGTRNMEELGGLAKRMPLTWATFLVAAAAIIGVPPLNGFVSEWLVYQGLFRAGFTSESLRLAVLAVPGLALVGGLALACFAKVAGVVFLGVPRTARADTATEPGQSLGVPAAALAAACVFIGCAPVLVVPSMLMAAAFISGRPLTPADAAVLAQRVGAQQISVVALALLVSGAAVWLVLRLLRARAQIRVGDTWGCGYSRVTPRMQYTASSFAAPLIDVFGALSGVRSHRGSTVFHSEPVDLVLDRGVAPAWAFVRRTALRLRPIQQGRLNRYLGFVIATLVLLLAYLVIGRGAAS
jgi:hydrogenase-4 component B